MSNVILPPDVASRVAASQAERQAGITWLFSVDGLHSTQHPPREWRLVQEGNDGRGWRLAAGDHATVIESVSRESDGKRWHHVSMARRDRDPSWAELRAVKEAFIGDREAYIVLPPASRYVNRNPHCLHLFSCLDAQPDGAILPDFTRGTGSL